MGRKVQLCMYIRLSLGTLRSQWVPRRALDVAECAVQVVDRNFPVPHQAWPLSMEQRQRDMAATSQRRHNVRHGQITFSLIINSSTSCRTPGDARFTGGPKRPATCRPVYVVLDMTQKQSRQRHAARLDDLQAGEDRYWVPP